MVASALNILAALFTFAVLKPMRMLSIPNEKLAPDRGG
jgi:hypothetical protein